MKIDLQNNIMVDGDGGFEGELQSKFSVALFFSIVLKFVFSAIFILALYVVEQRELGVLGSALNREKLSESNIQLKIQSKKKAIKILQKTKSKYINLKNRVFMMKKVSGSRLSFIKSMDSLNTFRSETLWFKTVKYDKGTLSFTGYAISKKILDEFLKNIRIRKNIFKSSLLRESKLEKIKGASVRFFSLETVLFN